MNRRASVGFTLLELLISLTLSTLVVLMLAVGMYTVLKDWERTGNRLEDQLELELVLLQLERALEGAFPHTYMDRDENKFFIFFEGDAEQLSWISTVSPGRQPGLTLWQLRPGEEEEQGIQIRVSSAFTRELNEDLETEAITALEGYQAHFEYLYVDEQIKEDSQWLDEWSAKKLQSLPQAVRLRLDKETDDTELEIIAIIQSYKHENEGRFRPIKP
ncbi:MAG: hypothetical protein SVR94_07895 [Pseudomonadota bacterium]|nr:hypothetical protein [Pseudomonadota bacterium]